MSEVSKWENSAPRVIAHRGASAYAPENTMAAFRKAVDLKADAIELDAKLLRDGNVVILHDNILDRTTNGTGNVYQFSYAELKSFDAGSHYSTDYRSETIPTLDEVFSEIGREILINVELTNCHRPWDRLTRSTIGLIHKFHLSQTILISSFNPWALIQAKKIDSTIARALLIDHGLPRIFREFFRNLVDCSIYHPKHTLIHEALKRDLFQSYCHLNVWTVNDRDHMMELIKLGVSGIITDYPDIARDVWHEFDQKMG
jgi:glycerophosphoryl diester phosphodiesterase